jgi:TolB-like protein/Flp pilus assembly protein TadD
MNSFFRELKRRNVYKVAAGYAVVGWLVVQIASTLLPTFHAPEGLLQGFVIIVALGFPIALIIAWAFEMTPEGMKRTANVLPNEPIPQWSRRKFAFFVAGTAIVAAALLAFQLIRSRSAQKQLAGSAPEKSIAVLPFENRSEEKANAFFADGIQDEILTRLAKIADLKVISRTSTLRYKSSPENLPEIAKQLGVAHVLEGSVQKAGDQVRVTVQLVRGVTDSHVWAETYDRKLTDIFAVESEIAETIARSLQAKLTPHEQQAVAAKPTENPAAYEEYLRGLAIWNKLTALPEDYDEMVRHFSRAVELDPKFALSWSFLSVAHSYNYKEFDPTPQRAAAAREALEHARNLQPNLGETQFAEGMYCYKVSLDFDQALEAFQKARERLAHRSLAIEFSSYVKRRQGKWDDALRLHGQSLEVDPRNPIILSEAALTYRALRRFEEARALIDRAREIEPGNAQLLVQKAEVFFAQGDSEAAGRLLKTVTVDVRDPQVTMTCVRFWVMMRQYPEAIRILQHVLAAPEKLPPAFGAIAANYRAELAITQALAENPEARAGLLRAREELTSIGAKGGEMSWTETLLLLVSGFLRDKATVDDVAAQLRHRIDADAMSGPSLEEAIAIAQAHLGETEVALETAKQLLKTPGENSLTPAYLRVDPLWDPLRSDPRFRELAEKKP